MGRSNHAGPAFEDDMQLEPTPETYVDLRGGVSDAGHDQSLTDKKTRVPV